MNAGINNTDQVVLDDGTQNAVDSVVVFSDQAYVTRKASTHVKPGINRIFVELKAFQIDQDSVQARVFGEGSILSVLAKTIPVKEAPQLEVRELDERRREVKRRLRGLTRERDSMDKRKTFLDSVVEFGGVEIPKELKTGFPEPKNLEEMLGFLTSGYQELAKSDDALQQEAEEIGRELKLIERKLKDSASPESSARKAVEILFESDAEQNLTLEVSHVARWARWEPVYKVDIAQSLDGVTMTMFARISQRTGENWAGVGLSVTNAVPLKSGMLPDLQSWQLSLPVAQFATDLIGSAAGSVAGEFLEAEEELDGAGNFEELVELDELEDLSLGEAGHDEANFQTADVNVSPVAFEYRLAQPVELGSSNDETLLPLFVKNLDGEFFHYAIPRQDPLTYLVCKTTGDSELLAGQLNLHFGGRFIGASRLDDKKAGEAILLNLGADRGVQVKREQVTDKKAETFFGMVDRNSVARELEHRIVVENLKDDEVKVQVIDPVPVSTTDRIQVKGVEFKPAPCEMDAKEREGVMSWDLDVPAQQTREIRIEFFVKHPKDIRPVGL